ncbi:DUF2798 domain-containing protein [Falsirhodobacter halotolerans]|uniref:DUF2798 domain-containing protein n=1 Tax=Falsirhodobacter halotolerans TaxID=1146892 RepID=UPI001FD04B9A|nr:DUF2798 domain-containing protein [Falsirhodobacter halotolerans]MCJ8138796.1 DUF2798 domain-containing protein [Falsirhodobacter halotolerans]
MIPARYAHVAFAFLLSGMMSFIVSGVAIARARGMAHLADEWIGGWLPSWAVAFPCVLVIAPIARRIVTRLTIPA